MEEKNISTILDSLAEVIRRLKFELYLSNSENERLKEELAKYKKESEAEK
jgi:hypothetical protein